MDRLLHKNNPFFHLKKEEVAEMLVYGRLLAFPKGSFLFSAGQSSKGIFSLLEGIVKITQIHGEREITIRFADKGDWVGHRSLFVRNTYLGSALAREDTLAFFVPSAILLKFFGSNANFASQVVRQISSDLEATERKLLDQQNLNVPSRLILLFRSLDKKFGTAQGEGKILNLRLTKVEIAEMIGASPEVVVRQLSLWKKNKLVQERDRRLLLSNRLLGKFIRDQGIQNPIP